MKGAATHHERIYIEMLRVENENMEFTINKEWFELELEKMRLNKKEFVLKDEELDLKEKVVQAKYDLRQQYCELKCKKLQQKK